MGGGGGGGGDNDVQVRSQICLLSVPWWLNKPSNRQAACQERICSYNSIFCLPEIEAGV